MIPVNVKEQEREPTDDDVRHIADEAHASVQSVWKRLAGGAVKGKVSGRIDRAIAAWRGRVEGGGGGHGA